ncbi:MAG: protoheme IX farnesyltransferase, partial [Flavobacteriales bacterium]
MMSSLAALFKLRLTLLVLVSAIMGYLMGCNEVDYSTILYLLSGGLLLTGGSNGMNQVLEREFDAL